jgi:hypothetical protein
MSHVRQQIREAAAALVTGLATTSTRVFQSRIYPLRDADLPCLLVMTDDEDINSDGISSPALQDRTLRLVIKVVAKANANLDDALDSIAAEVETAIGSTTFSGKAKSCLLESINVDMSDELEKPSGTAALNFRVNYFTATGAPGTAL